jgi:hypothetical protein
MLSSTTIEEASLVAAGIANRFPLVGFYSGVEMAPFQSRSRPFDWTGVLTLLMKVEPFPPQTG